MRWVDQHLIARVRFKKTDSTIRTCNIVAPLFLLSPRACTIPKLANLPTCVLRESETLHRFSERAGHGPHANSLRARHILRGVVPDEDALLGR